MELYYPQTKLILFPKELSVLPFLPLLKSPYFKIFLPKLYIEYPDALFLKQTYNDIYLI